MRLNVSPLCRVVQIVNGFYAAGGCVHIKGSSPTFTNVLMRDCAASVFALLSLAPAGGGGGAVMVYGAGAAPMFQRCSFWNCTTASLYGGGAIRIQTSATPTFEDCDFVGGASQGGGGAARGSLAAPRRSAQRQLTSGAVAFSSGQTISRTPSWYWKTSQRSVVKPWCLPTTEGWNDQSPIGLRKVPASSAAMTAS